MEFMELDGLLREADFKSRIHRTADAGAKTW